MLFQEFLIFINQALETSLHLLDESVFVHCLRIKGFLINLLSDVPSVCHLYLVGVKTEAFVIGMFKKSASIMALSILMLPSIENRTLVTRMRLVIFLTFICIPASKLEKLIFHFLVLILRIYNMESSDRLHVFYHWYECAMLLSIWHHHIPHS